MCSFKWEKETCVQNQANKLANPTGAIPLPPPAPCPSKINLSTLVSFLCIPENNEPVYTLKLAILYIQGACSLYHMTLHSTWAVCMTHLRATSGKNYRISYTNVCQHCLLLYITPQALQGMCGVLKLSSNKSSATF